MSEERSEGGFERVLDASALLAWLRDEPGAEVVEKHLLGSFVSAVNLSEVLQKSLAEGIEISGMAEDLVGLGLSLINFGIEEAQVAAALWPTAKPLGLGIADRACMATAVVLELPTLTADRPWQQVEWEGLTVEVIR